MNHSFLQKLILVIVAGAIAAGLFEFYKEFVLGSLHSVPANTHYNYHPVPTPRRF